MEEHDEIVYYTDKILQYCPMNDGFGFNDIVDKTDLDEAVKNDFINKELKIRYFLIKNKYAQFAQPMFPVPGEIYKYYLTDIGRSVKNAGGHFKFIENSSKQFDENNKQNFEKEKFDLLTKKWVYKTRWLPIILSGIALIISLLSYFQKDIEIKNKQDNKQNLNIDTININKNNQKQKDILK